MLAAGHRVPALDHPCRSRQSVVRAVAGARRSRGHDGAAFPQPIAENPGYRHLRLLRLRRGRRDRVRLDGPRDLYDAARQRYADGDRLGIPARRHAFHHPIRAGGKSRRNSGARLSSFVSISTSLRSGDFDFFSPRSFRSTTRRALQTSRGSMPGPLFSGDSPALFTVYFPGWYRARALRPRGIRRRVEALVLQIIQ